MSVNTTMMEIPVPWPEVRWNGEFEERAYCSPPFEPTPESNHAFISIDVKHFSFAMSLPKVIAQVLGPAASSKVFKDAVKEAHEAWLQSFIFACKKMNLMYWQTLKQEINNGRNCSPERERVITKALADALVEYLDHVQGESTNREKKARLLECSNGQRPRTTGENKDE